MNKSFVVVAVDLIKDPSFDQEFRYRAYVNSELFTERTWVWDNRFYLEENITIEAPPGKYRIDIQVHGASAEVLKITNMRIVEGPGRLDKNALILE